ncbi:polysaccharide lyase [Lacinutrix iliipiscaria]|uniref:Polysaccharide lyase n=1 Tax=Lacinutrix iliipiscaria TaxID=1230532 RepID=A0ABW5WIW1_9FLAO
MKNIITFLILTAFMFSCNYKPVLKFDFDKDLNQPHIKKLLSHKLIELNENEGINNSNAIKVSYVGYEKGSRIVARIFELPEGLEEATLNFSVKFSKDFKFVKSGKIHGLIPNNKIVGGKKMQDDGWSVRATFKEKGEIASYIYYQNKPNKWGDGITSSNTVFTRGEYNDVAIYVKLNKPVNSKNGRCEIWVDGILQVSQELIQYRSAAEDSSLITHFYFDTFHGGHTPDYSPKNEKGEYTTEYAWFDNFEIYKGKYIKALKQ